MLIAAKSSAVAAVHAMASIKPSGLGLRASDSAPTTTGLKDARMMLNMITKAISRAKEAALSIGKPDTLQDQIAAQLKQLQFVQGLAPDRSENH